MLTSFKMWHIVIVYQFIECNSLSEVLETCINFSFLFLCWINNKYQNEFIDPYFIQKFIILYYIFVIIYNMHVMHIFVICYCNYMCIYIYLELSVYILTNGTTFKLLLGLLHMTESLSTLSLCGKTKYLL